MVNMKLHLNSPRNWADWDQCNVENSRIAKIQGYLRPKDMPGPRMWSKYARYLCIASQCWRRQSPHRVIFIRQTRPIVPSLLGWHELLATSPESQRLQLRRCFTEFYSGLVNKRNLSGGYAGHFFAALDSSIETLSVQIWKCVHLYIYRTPVHWPIAQNGEHEITPELTQELSGLGSVQCW